jgi:hypothetical protein
MAVVPQKEVSAWQPGDPSCPSSLAAAAPDLELAAFAAFR